MSMICRYLPAIVPMVWLSVLIGCTTVESLFEKESDNRQIAGKAHLLLAPLSSNAEEVRRIGAENARFVYQLVQGESSQYACKHGRCADGAHAWPADLPRLCIALSGGGIRSAAFSLGVLQSLQREGVMDSVDVISATSGGSYTLSMLMAQHANRGAGGEPDWRNLLGEDAPAIKHLASKEGACLIPDLWGVGAAAGGVLTAPTASQVRFGHATYKIAIEDTFLSSVLAGASMDRRVYGETPLGRVAERLGKFPLPIITATARTGQHGGACVADNSTRPSLADSIIEFTPTRVRYAQSVSTGLVSLKLSELAAMAGAALSDPFAKNCEVRERFNVSLLRFVQLPGTSERLAITDGGFSDNLAAYPLIQRLCRTTLIVDGEHDPKMEFEALRRLEIGLTSEGTGFSTQPADRCITAELVGSRAIIRGGEAAELNRCVPSSTDTGFRANRWPSERSVFEMRAGRYPFLDAQTGNLQSLGLQIVYVKLAMGPLDCHGAGSSPYAQRYCEEQKSGKVACSKRGLADDCPFPQQSTFHQCFAGPDFEAYRSLGGAHGLLAAKKVKELASRSQ